MASIIDDQEVIRAIKGIHMINYSLVEGGLWFFGRAQSYFRADVKVESLSKDSLEPFDLACVSNEHGACDGRKCANTYLFVMPFFELGVIEIVIPSNHKHCHLFVTIRNIQLPLYSILKPCLRDSLVLDRFLGKSAFDFIVHRRRALVGFVLCM